MLAVAVASAFRQEFLGDGVRHVSLVFGTGAPHLGEARWLLFPPLLFALLWPFTSIGLVQSVEAAIQPFLWTSVAAGLVFLWSLRSWLVAEQVDARRRAAALLLAASCAPFLRLFSDIAEPQIPAAIVLAALAVARARQNDPARAVPAVIGAIAVIASASLLYQGVILALGLVPLAASTSTLKHRPVIVAFIAAPVAVALALVMAQATAGVPLALAAQTTFGGEHNPLMRSFMGSHSPVKYAVALAAGPSQGLVWIPAFGGLTALAEGIRGAGRPAAIVDLLRLAIGLVIVLAMVSGAVRHRDWRAIVAMLSLAALPVLRNQQYAYVKFYVLWPAVAAVIATRYRARAVAVAASILLAMNGWVLAQDVERGRRSYASITSAYRNASPSSCFMTAGWTPPFHYRWPGTATGIIATLATGDDPVHQGKVLTHGLRDCFCGATDVWTDTTRASGPAIAQVAEHFRYGAIDLSRILAEPPRDSRGLPTVPSLAVYSRARQAENCGTLSVLPDR